MPPTPTPPYNLEQSYAAQPGCLTGCAVAILWVHRLAWRHRAALKPFGLALGVLAVTVTVRTAYGYRLAWQPFTLLGGLSVGAAAGLWFFGDQVRLDRRVERAYAAAVAVACGVWAEAACYRGPLYPPLLLALLLGTVAGGLPWWWHRRVRRKRTDPIKAATADWDDIAPKLGLEGVELVEQEVSRDGQRWRIRFLLPRWMTVTEFRRKVKDGALDVAFDLRQRACRTEEIPARARLVDVHITPGDPRVKPLELPPLPRVVSVLDPLLVAADPDGKPAALHRMHERHGLLGASTGGGKSSFIHGVMRVWGRAVDGLVWGIDMGGGSTLGAWRSRLGRFTTDATTGLDILTAAVAVMERRLATLGDGEDDTVRVSPELPALKVIIDEYDEMVAQEPEAASKVDTIVRRGRKAAVTVLLTSLRPTKEALGSKAIRQQLSVRVLLPVNEAQDADLILGSGRRAREGWNPLLLDEPGKMLVLSPEHQRPRPRKGYWISKKGALALAGEYAAAYPLPRLEQAASPPGSPPPGPPDSPPGSPILRPTDSPPAAHWASPTSRPPRSLVGNPAGSPPAGPPTSPLPGPGGNGHDGPVGDNPMSALLDALTAAGESGARAEELAARINRSRTWTYERLQELERAGRVVRIRPTGRWRLASTEEGG